MKSKFFFLFFTLIFLCSCSSFGTKKIIDADLILKIEKGKSSKADVKALLEDPVKITFTDNNEEIWEYSYSKSTIRPATFIPCLGLLAGGADTEIHSLTLRFGADGIVKGVGKGKMISGGGSIFD